MPPLTSLTRVLTLAVVMLIALKAHAELPREVSAQLARLGIDDRGLSVVVRRVDADGPLLAHHADVPRNPASTMKLVTTYAGLDLLGPAYRWHTRVYADGSVRDGRLDGDLVLKGGGDPYLVIEDYWRLLHAIRDRGIERIDGDLVIDDTVFDRAAIGTDAIDGREMRSYNTPPEALLVNFRATRFVVVPGSRSVRVFADPPATTLAIDNRLEPASGACQGGQRNIGFHVVPGSGRTSVRFSGRYPSRCGEWSLTRTVLPADQYQLGVFKAVWAEMGGSLAGGLRYGRAPAAEPLVDHASRPLAEALAGINKYSNNVMARQLLLTLAAETGAGPASPQAGAAAIRDWLDSRGTCLETF